MPRTTGTVRAGLSGFPAGFWWLWTSTLVNRLGTFVYPFLTLYLTVDLGYSAGFAGLVLSVFGLGSTAGALLGGELSDRVGRRPTMAGAQVATAVFTAALGFTTTPAAIAAVTFAFGVAASVSRPAVLAMMSDLVGPKDRVRAFSVNYWAINIGFGISAAIAGFIAHQGYLWLFLGDAATTLLCAVVMWFKLPETRPATAGEAVAGEAVAGEATAGEAVAARSPGTPRPGLRQVLHDTPFMFLTAMAFAIWVLFYQGSTSLAVIMAGKGLGTGDYGLVISLNGFLIVLLQIPVTRLAMDRKKGSLLAVSALLYGCGFGLTAFGGASTSFYALTVAIWTLGEILYAPAASATVAEMAPENSRGRYQGVFTFGMSAASFVAPLIGGITLDHWGGATLWGGCAVLGAVAAVGFWALPRVPRTMPRHEELATVEG